MKLNTLKFMKYLKISAAALLLLLFPGMSDATSPVLDIKTTSKFELQGPPRMHGDTLELDISSLDSANYFFYPFGEYSNRKEISKSIQRELGKPTTPRRGGIRFAGDKGDTVEFVFKKRSETEKFELVASKIVTIVGFQRNGIRINMGKTPFLKIFFKKYPEINWNTFNVIETITGPIYSHRYSGDSAIRHFYKFREDHLKEIQIEAFQLN